MARFRIIEGKCALQPDLAAEGRDTERAIRLWHEKAADGCIPDLARFDFNRLHTDWGYRFLISGDEFVGAAVFILYGLQFAKLLGLPAKPNSQLPMIRQLPAYYRDLFVEGCDEVLIKSEPARFSGAVRHGNYIELYRAAFMPLRGKDTLRPLIYGAFNRRSVPLTTFPGSFNYERIKADRLYEEKPQRN